MIAKKKCFLLAYSSYKAVGRIAKLIIIAKEKMFIA